MSKVCKVHGATEEVKTAPDGRDFCMHCVADFWGKTIGEMTELPPELKPCPFCGCSAEARADGDAKAHIHCRSCGAQGPSSSRPDHYTGSWNRRA